MPGVMRAVRGRRRWATSLCWVLSACDGGYPLPPTACDEWCRTSQRKQCPDDNPVNCVSQCESERTLSAHCDQLLLAQIECYDRIPDDAFACDPYSTYLSRPHCDQERYAFQSCGSIENECFAFCENFVARCEGQSIISCATGCYVDERCWEPFQSYYACLDHEGLACDASNIDLICQSEGAKLDACRNAPEN